MLASKRLMIRHLNIGCGEDRNFPHRAGREKVELDLVAGGVRGSALALPFRDESFESARAIHVLEHIPRADHDSFISEAKRVLKPGGVLWVEVPNLLEACRKLVVAGDKLEKGTEDPERAERLMERIRIYTLSLYGKNRHVGDSHCWGFMPYLLRETLSQYGFSEVELIEGDPQSREYQEAMISEHWTQEDVILAKATK